jgi:hypothetical protein
MGSLTGLFEKLFASYEELHFMQLYVNAKKGVKVVWREELMLYIIFARRI